jgi:integrase/recombinase XerC
VIIPEVEKYLVLTRQKYAVTTNISIRIILNNFLLWCIGCGLDFYAATRSDIERYLLSRPIKNHTRRKRAMILQQFYAWLRVPENPAAEITFSQDASVRLPRIPSQHTIETIFDRLVNLKGKAALRNRLILELSYGSGLRRTELWSLDIEDIDLDGCTMEVTGKGDKIRTVPLTHRAADLLRQYLIERPFKRSSGPLLVNYRNGRRLGIAMIAKVIKTNTGFSSHMFRHACATHMLENGCNIRYLQELLGHTRLTTTTIYTHVTKQELGKILAASHPRGQNISLNLNE